MEEKPETVLGESAGGAASLTAIRLASVSLDRCSRVPRRACLAKGRARESRHATASRVEPADEGSRTSPQPAALKGRLHGGAGIGSRASLSRSTLIALIAPGQAGGIGSTFREECTNNAAHQPAAMARYIELPTSRKDAEEHSHDEQGSALPYAASDSYSQAAGDRESSTSNRRVVALFGAGLLLLVVLSTGYHWANWVRTPRTFFGPPPSKHLEIDLRRGNVPGPAELLTSAAPAASYRKALRPELRYLTRVPSLISSLLRTGCLIEALFRTRRADSFNGWTGHVLAAFSLLYLAQLTQRVAIL